MSRKTLKTWRGPLFVLAMTVVLLTSLFVIPTVFAKIGVNLDQFQNGQPVGTGAAWNNGSINAQNSAYREGQSIPFRYFITGVTPNSEHFFTINWEYKKGGKPAYDYLTSFDRSFAAGLHCSSVSTAVPGDCAAPTTTAQFPDPGLGATNGYLPFVQNVANGDRLLKAYNVQPGSISFSNIYVVGGTASDPELSLTVSFRAVSAGSVGFYWGGHLARGLASDWGANNGASSISGAPFHMRGINLDNSGKTNQDRSVQPGAVLPDAGCGIGPLGAVCSGSDKTYSSSTTAAGATYNWSILGNGSFVISDGQGGTTTTTANQTTTTVTVRAGAAGTYTLGLTTDGSGFEPTSCSVEVTVNANPVISIVADTTSCGAPKLSVSGAQAGDTIAWTGPSGGIPTGQEDDVDIYPTKTGTYSVQITRSGCASNVASGNICFTFTAAP